MTLQEATLEQLKAIAYDELVKIEQIQNNLQIINSEIAKRTKMVEDTQEIQETNQEVIDPAVETTEITEANLDTEVVEPTE